MGTPDPAGAGRVLVFGASGAIGEAIGVHYSGQGWNVVRVTRGVGRASGDDFMVWDPMRDDPAGESATYPTTSW